jgi:hypothetical protein
VFFLPTSDSGLVVISGGYYGMWVDDPRRPTCRTGGFYFTYLRAAMFIFYFFRGVNLMILPKWRSSIIGRCSKIWLQAKYESEKILNILGY